MSNEFEEIVRQEWEKFNKKEHYPNILILGQTGVGKSSLINTIFNKELAAVNDVARGTTEFKYYYGKDNNTTVNLIDSQGYELENDSFNNYLKAIKDEIAENKKNPDKSINIIWFCISLAGHRVQKYDTEIINQLCDIPEIKEKVAVVITKCDQDDEDGSEAKKFRKIIREDVKKEIAVFETSNDKKLPLEINELIKWSVDHLDSDDLKDAFNAAQMIDIQAKRNKAAKRIAAFSTAAAAIGGMPFIPFSDAALLVPDQLLMATHIIRIYGINNLLPGAEAVIGDVIIANIGKALAGNIIKLIPAVGPIVGVVVDASVAFLITAAIGYAISEICYNTCKSILKGENVDFENIFSQEKIKPLMEEFLKNAQGSSKEDIINMIKKGLSKWIALPKYWFLGKPVSERVHLLIIL